MTIAFLGHGYGQTPSTGALIGFLPDFQGATVNLINQHASARHALRRFMNQLALRP
jgi:hypothetical protein